MKLLIFIPIGIAIIIYAIRIDNPSLATGGAIFLTMGLLPVIAFLVSAYEERHDRRGR